MTPGERQRLLGILGRISSDFAGERDAAALAATRMLRSLGYSWDEMIVPAPGSAALLQSPRTAATPLRQQVATVLRKPWLLKPRELEFLRSIVSWRRELSPKQQVWLADIIKRADDISPRSAA